MLLLRALIRSKMWFFSWFLAYCNGMENENNVITFIIIYHYNLYNDHNLIPNNPFPRSTCCVVSMTCIPHRNVVYILKPPSPFSENGKKRKLWKVIKHYRRKKRNSKNLLTVANCNFAANIWKRLRQFGHTFSNRECENETQNTPIGHVFILF